MYFYHQIAGIHLSEHAFVFSHQHLSQTQIKQRDDGQSQSRVLRSLQHVCLCILRARLHCGFSSPLEEFFCYGTAIPFLDDPKAWRSSVRFRKSKQLFPSFRPSPQPKEERGCQESVMLLRPSGFASWNFGCETTREFIAARMRF